MENDVVWLVRVSAEELAAAGGDVRRAVKGALGRARITGVVDVRPEPRARGTRP